MNQILGQSEVGQFLTQVMERGYFPWILIVGGIVICSVVKSVTGAIVGVARERTRREIAAYIAEGNMSPEQGEKLMKARAEKC
ncbi:MAG: hypothetical protein U0573_00595 [Phycisphaerales bacterium]|nr:hypothetical protein [Planctomycetota bacterium]